MYLVEFIKCRPSGWVFEGSLTEIDDKISSIDLFWDSVDEKYYRMSDKDEKSIVDWYLVMTSKEYCNFIYEEENLSGLGDNGYLFSVFSDKKGMMWVIVDDTDLCNCIAEPIGHDGKWILCVDKSCKDNDLSDIKFISEKKDIPHISKYHFDELIEALKDPAFVENNKDAVSILKELVS